MSSACGIPTVTCVFLLLVLGALYATASVEVSDLPGITTDVKPRDPKGSTTVWRRRIWKQGGGKDRGRQSRVADSGSLTGVLSPRIPGGRRGNERTIIDNECGPDGAGCRRRGGRRRGGRRKERLPFSPFTRRQLRLAEKLTNASAIFVGNLLTHTLGRGRLKDFCVSPFSVHMALTFLTLGAKGSTQRQIFNVAGLKATRLRRAKAHRAYHTILTTLAMVHPSVRMLTANAVFVKRGIPLALAFQKNLEQLYQAKFSYYPEAPSLEAPINDWVSMATQDNIPKLLPKGTIDKDTEMIVINAMAISAPWQREFNVSLTRPHVFETLSRDLQQVQMMEMSSEFRYKEDQGMKIVEIPYQSNQMRRLAMYVVLPDLSSSLRHVLDMFTGKNRTNPRGASSIDVIFHNLKAEKIKLRMPKFKIESHVLDLSRVLKRMGVRKAFNRRKANFTGITFARQLRVDKFLHKTIVQVDEHGSYVKLPTPPPAIDESPDDVTEPSIELVVDRPFLFFIHDVHTRLTLVNGIYTGDDLGPAKKSHS